MPEDTYLVSMRGKTYSFPTSVPIEDAGGHIDRNFPPTGSEVRDMMKMDPEYELTLPHFKTYEKFQNERSFGSKVSEGLDMVPSVIDHLSTVLGDGIGATFDSNPLKAPANVVEGFLQGTAGLWQMIANSENPDAMMFELEDFIWGDGTIESRYEQTKEARSYRLGLERKMAGDETILMPKEWVDNRIVQATALVADPTLFLGGVGLAAKVPRLAALGQKAAMAGRKATQAGLHATGTAMRTVAAPVTKGIQAAGRGIESATGVSAKNIHGGAVLAGGASLANPVTATVGSVVVGAEALNLGGDLLQRLSKGIGSQPSRIKALQSIALDASAPKSVRVFAHAAHKMGGDLALDLGVRGAAGAGVGVAVGGLFGLGYDDIQGAIPASAAGAALGAAGAGLFRSVEHGLGRVALEGQKADGTRWLASIENPRRRTQAMEAASIMENQIPGSSALLADAAITMDAIGGQLRFVNEKVSKRIGGQENSQGFFEPRQIGDKPTVIVNLDSFGKTTAPHEVVHALLKTVAGGEQLVAARESLFGTISPDGTINSDGIVGSATLREFAEKYKSLMDGDAKETWDGFIRDAFNDQLDLVQRLAAQSEIADEFTAYYGGYSSFSKGLFGKTRYNNSLMTGKIESVVGVVVRNARKLFEGRTRRQLKMDFTGASIESPFANAKHPGMKRFVMDVMKGSRDTQTEGNATRVRYNMKKATQEGMQALADAGYQSAFVRDADGKVVRQRTAGEERAQMRAQYNTLRDALVKEGIEPESKMQVNDDGTKSFNLGEIFATIDPAKLPTLMKAMEKFLGPNHRRFITQVASQLTGGMKNEFDLTYWAATTRSKRDSAVYASLGVSQRNVVPYTVEVSEAGGVYVRAIDMNAVSKRFNKAFQKVKGLFNTREQAMDDFHSYMENLTSDNPIPSKDLKLSGLPLGEAKRNFFHEVLGTVPSQKNRPPLDRLPRPGYVPEHGVDKVFKSFRVDRMSKLDSTGRSLSFTEEKTYQRSQANFQPDGGEALKVIDYSDAVGGKSFELDKPFLSRFMPASGKVDLADYANKTVIALAADRMGVGEMMVGPTGHKRALSVSAQGGRGFMNIFNGGGWAFSDASTASRFIKRLSKDADSKGNAIVGITIQSPINHLKNQTGQLAYIETMQAAIDSKTITKKAANAQVKAMVSSINSSGAASLKAPTKAKFESIKNFADLEAAIRSKSLNFADMDPLLTQMQRKKLPITAKEQTEMGMATKDIADGLADAELLDLPFGTVVALLKVNVKQVAEKNNFHYSYPFTVHGEAIGYLDKFYNISDLTSSTKIRNKKGMVSAQPLQTVMPIMDNITKTIKSKEGIPSDPNARFQPGETGEGFRFQPSEDRARPSDVLDELRSTSFIPNKVVARALGEFPEYLIPVTELILAQREKLVSGTLTMRDLMKAYTMTIASMGVGAVNVNTLQSKLSKLGIDFSPEELFTDKSAEGETNIRPEEAAAWWLGTESGKKALDNAESGNVNPADWSELVEVRRAFGDNRFQTFRVFGPKSIEKLPKVLSELNGSEGKKSKVLSAVTQLNGVKNGKKGFISHLLGMGETPTIDEGDTRHLTTKKADLVRRIKDTFSDKRISGEMFRRIDQRIKGLRKKLPGGMNIPEETFAHIMHHWIWDKAKGLETTHKGLYEAQAKFQPQDADHMKAVESGDMETAQRMVDEAAKEAGYKVGPVFHGTNSKFNVFDTDTFGSWFSEHENLSRSYFNEEDGGKIIPAYLKIDNLLEIPETVDMSNEVSAKKALNEVNRANGTSFSIEDIGYPADYVGMGFEYFGSAGDVFIKKAIEKGYDGLTALETGDRTYNVFDPQNIKSSDPVTYDDSGNVIPLSERFNKASDDTRFQPQDADYMKAVESGDTDAAALMVERSATEAGYKYQHNQASENFSDGRYIKQFSSIGDHRIEGYGEHVFYSRELPAVPEWVKDIAEEMYGDRDAADPTDIVDSANAWDDIQFISNVWEYAEGNGLDATGFRTPDGAVILDSETPGSVASAAPVKRDADGNTVPLSKRFQPDDGMGQIDGDAGPVERSVPAPVLSGASRNVPTAKEALSWLTADKRKKGRARGKAKAGQRVGLRIDIPAYQKSNFEVYTVSVHDHSKNPRSKAGPVIGYEPHAYVEGPLDFVVNEKFAERIKDGDVSKNTIAVVEGNWRTKDIVPKDIESWTQVGMNPKRHSYFYDRETFRPVTGGDEAFSVGGTVFVKDAIFGEAADFRFQPDDGSDGRVRQSSAKPEVPTMRRVNSPSAGYQSYRRRSRPNG